MEFREQWKVAYKVKQNLDDISDAMVSTQGLKTISGPVYLTEGGKHSFDVIERNLNSLKQINGHVYLNKHTHHSQSRG